MNALVWRRTLADVVDGSVALMPLAAVTVWCMGAIGSAVSDGPAALVLYGVPAAVFVGPSVWWALSVRRVRSGSTGRRTIGQTVAGVEVRDGRLIVSDLRGPARERVLRAGATALATAAVLVFAFILVSILAVGVGLARSGDSYAVSKARPTLSATLALRQEELERRRCAARLVLTQSQAQDIDNRLAVGATAAVAVARRSPTVTEPVALRCVRAASRVLVIAPIGG